MAKHPDKWASIPPPMLKPMAGDDPWHAPPADDWNGYRPPRQWWDGWALASMLAASVLLVLGVVAVAIVTLWPR
jgi:hypothetical protein